MPWRIRKPYIIVNGQRLVSPNEPAKRLPWCDQCDTLAANNAPLYTELAPDRWWKWLSFPKFSCEDEAFMGCANHPVEAKVKYLDGRVEPFVSLPHTRWKKLTEPYALVLAVLAAIVVGVVLKLVFGL